MTMPQPTFPNSCIVIAEVALAHDGSLGTAHAYIDAVANAGAHAVKFQTHIAEAESTPLEPWRVKFSLQDSTRYDYWRRTAFTEAQWQGLRMHAEERGLLFLSSPFSLEAAQMLSRIGVSAWKIASGEIVNRPTLDFVCSTGLPVIVSTGMSSIQEIDKTMIYLRERGCEPTLLQCTTAYPCPPEKIGFNMLQLFKERYGCPVGLSDHSGTIFPGLAAATLGASVIEVHVVFSRECFGPDVCASLTTVELKQLVNGVQFIQTALNNPVDKDAIASSNQELRHTFTKSIVAKVSLPAGSILREQHLALKKPGNGLPPDRMPGLIGRRLARPLTENQMILEDDLESIA